ncbi:MAG: NfeD family protein [Chloroflexi bacterium]|nr:NfeD family protein [Chloroflexota bacterium]
MDPLETVFVFCFVFGLAMSLLSLLLGAFHTGDGGHALAEGHHDVGHLGGHSAAHVGGDGASGNGGHAAHVMDGEASERGTGVSPLNLPTITTFLAFFGGAGWVTHGSLGIGPALALIVAVVAGTIGGGAAFLFLARVLLAGQQFMDPNASRIEGTVGRVSRAIRPGVTGEIVFTHEGTRRSEGARSATGKEIAAGTEVVIVRYEAGLAYVEPWTTYAGE